MIDVNLSRLSSDVTTLLMLRGTAPSLCWQDRPNQGAKRILDEIDNTKLLGVRDLQSEPMAAAVRALLYLWNGWIADCAMCARGAGQKECLYINGFAQRVSAQPDQAKKVFQRLGHHPVYERVLAHFLETVGEPRDPALKRVREVAKLGGAWEPFAFVDLCEQARTGKLSCPSAQLVTQLQRKEFELLFCYCYEGATGVDPAQQDARDVSKRPRKIERKPKPPDKHPPETKPESPEADTGHADGKSPSRPDPTVSVVCPQCRSHLVFAGSARGKQAKCGKCGTIFTVVPQREAVAKPVPASG